MQCLLHSVLCARVVHHPKGLGFGEGEQRSPRQPAWPAPETTCNASSFEPRDCARRLVRDVPHSLLGSTDNKIDRLTMMQVGLRNRRKLRLWRFRLLLLLLDLLGRGGGDGRRSSGTIGGLSASV